MSARNYIETFGAGETKRLPAGRYFYVRSVVAAIDILTEGVTGSPGRFIGIGGGTKYGPVEEGQGWKKLAVTSATAQTVEIIISDDGNFEVASAVTVSGSVTTAESPSTAITDAAAVALPNAATTQIVAANLTRKKVTISNPSTALGSFFLRSSGGVNNLLEVQPGTSQEVKTTARIDGRNDSGGALSALVFEES